MKLLKGFLQGFTSMLISATLFIGCLRVGKVFYENYDINSSLTWIVTLISLTISLVVFWALITYIDILEDKKRLENELVLLRSDKHHLGKVLDATREDYIKQMDLKDDEIDGLITVINTKPYDRIKRIENYKGTTVYTLLYMMEEMIWNIGEAPFEVTFNDDYDKKTLLTYNELKEKYGDCVVIDYDLYHEMYPPKKPIEEQDYLATGWLQLEIDETDQIPFAHDSAPETSIVVCPVCKKPMRETAKMYICDSAVGHKKQWRKEEVE